MATSNRIPTGAGTLLEIEFEILEDALPGAVSPLELIEAILNNHDPATVTTGGSVTIDGATGLVGDFNGDCEVDFYDFLIFIRHFPSSEGGPNWEPICDLNSDGRIGFADFLIFVANFGKFC